MIVIDGSEGEGGGQILRSSLTLAVLTGQPFRIENIRAGRPKSGLLRQHLTALQGAAAICGGKFTDGTGLGAKEVEFYPGSVRAGNYEFAVGTAGSAMLVFQTVLLPLLMAEEPSRVIITGGTHNPAAPTFEFITRVFLPLLQKMGADINLRLISYGFMPAGGGRIMADIKPAGSLKPLELLARGDQRDIYAEAFFANLPFEVAERELEAIGSHLSLPGPAKRVREVKSSGPGNVMMVTVESENTTDAFTGFGRRGLRAEEVAREVADEAKDYLASDIAVGPHLADQLMLPMAIAGGGAFTTGKPTRHARTNAATIARFLPIETTFEPLEEKRGVTVRITPVQGNA